MSAEAGALVIENEGPCPPERNPVRSGSDEVSGSGPPPRRPLVPQLSFESLPISVKLTARTTASDSQVEVGGRKKVEIPLISGLTGAGTLSQSAPLVSARGPGGQAAAAAAEAAQRMGRIDDEEEGEVGTAGGDSSAAAASPAEKKARLTSTQRSSTALAGERGWAGEVSWEERPALPTSGSRRSIRYPNGGESAEVVDVEKDLAVYLEIPAFELAARRLGDVSELPVAAAERMGLFPEDVLRLQREPTRNLQSFDGRIETESQQSVTVRLRGNQFSLTAIEAIFLENTELKRRLDRTSEAMLALEDDVARYRDEVGLLANALREARAREVDFIKGGAGKPPINQEQNPTSPIGAAFGSLVSGLAETIPSSSSDGGRRRSHPSHDMPSSASAPASSNRHPNELSLPPSPFSRPVSAPQSPRDIVEDILARERPRTPSTLPPVSGRSTGIKRRVSLGTMPTNACKECDSCQRFLPQDDEPWMCAICNHRSVDHAA